MEIQSRFLLAAKASQYLNKLFFAPRLRDCRPRVPLSLHFAVAQNAASVPTRQPRLGVPKVRPMSEFSAGIVCGAPRRSVPRGQSAAELLRAGPVTSCDSVDCSRRVRSWHCDAVWAPAATFSRSAADATSNRRIFQPILAPGSRLVTTEQGGTARNAIVLWGYIWKLPARDDAMQVPGQLFWASAAGSVAKTLGHGARLKNSNPWTRDPTASFAAAEVLPQTSMSVCRLLWVTR